MNANFSICRLILVETTPMCTETVRTQEVESWEARCAPDAVQEVKVCAGSGASHEGTRRTTRGYPK